MRDLAASSRWFITAINWDHHRLPLLLCQPLLSHEPGPKHRASNEQHSHQNQRLNRFCDTIHVFLHIGECGCGKVPRPRPHPFLLSIADQIAVRHMSATSCVRSGSSGAIRLGLNVGRLGMGSKKPRKKKICGLKLESIFGVLDAFLRGRISI
jgi:hypothetical protein